jgi:galactokinase
LRRSGQWTDYPLGVAEMLARAGAPAGGFSARFESTLPAGAGLSSSAALEVATALLLSKLYPFQMAPMDLAKLCRRAENEFVGVNCGSTRPRRSSAARTTSCSSIAGARR